MDAPLPAPSFHRRADGLGLAYRFCEGSGPLVVFLPGYMSDMEGGKAHAVFNHARARGQACLLLDYSGCGSSEGTFAHGTLDIWRDDALLLIDHLWQGSILPVGSSMGGWIALLIALARPRHVAALVGIATAPDFTQWGFTDAEKAALAEHGFISEPSAYDDSERITTLGFWSSGQANRVLDGPVAIDCPVRLLHGQQDEVVPWTLAPQIAEALRSSDVQTVLIKDGDHRLSRDGDIATLIGLIDSLMERR